MDIERIDEVAHVRLRGGKANAMSADFLRRLIELIDAAEASDARALVITGHGTAFSAGLALPDLIGLDRSGMRAFIDLFGAAMLRVFRCGLPVVAAVNGHAIAGGCVLALQADVRMMADVDAKIGLNEVQLGIGLPAAVVEPLRLAVPRSSLVAIALEGRLLVPAEALRLGLVDEVVPEIDLDWRSIARAKELGRAPLPAFRQVKEALRRPALEALLQRADEERERWLDTWFSPPAQTLLTNAVARLRGSKGAS